MYWYSSESCSFWFLGIKLEAKPSQQIGGRVKTVSQPNYITEFHREKMSFTAFSDFKSKSKF